MYKQALTLAAFIISLAACSAGGTSTTGSTQSALSGTVDATAATNCATVFVACDRNGGTTCLDDLEACIEAGTSTTGDAGTATKDAGGHGGKGGNCKADGTIDRSGIEACLTALETCAKGDAGIDTCVADVVTCVTASSAGTAEAGATTTVK